MTFAEGITLGIIGTTITVIGFAIAYHIGSDHRKEDEEIRPILQKIEIEGFGI